MFKISDGVKNLVGGLADGDGPHVPACTVAAQVGRQGEDLAEGEPGEGREHEVEQVLTNMDHDVIILEDSFLDCFTEIYKTK